MTVQSDFTKVVKAGITNELSSQLTTSTESMASTIKIEPLEVVDYVEGTPNEVALPDSEEQFTDYRKFIKTDYTREKIESLKVSADTPDTSPEEKKRRVKNLAGAISHSLRLSGEINVRAFGRDAIAKSAKAIAIARDYLIATHKNLQLSCSPAFINTEVNGNNISGIGFCCFVVDTDEGYADPDQCETKLFVKADPQDCDPELRRHNVRKLAGAITHAIEEHKSCAVRCFGKDSIAKASKAIAIARGFVATKGPDLYCWDKFIVSDMNGQERTGIVFFCYCNS